MRADLLDANGSVVCAACAATGEAKARLDAGRSSAHRAAELRKLLAVVGVVLGGGIIVVGILFGAIVFVYLQDADLLGLRLAAVFLFSVGVASVVVCIRKFLRFHRSGQ
jgi:formate/nitrite transporter FocA (FNT family)